MRNYTQLINWDLAKYHLLAWTVLILYEVVVAGYITQDFGYLSSHIFYYTTYVILFYLHSYLLKKVLHIENIKKRILLILTLIVVEILFFSFCVCYINNFFVVLELFTTRIEFNRLFLLSMTWRMLYFIMLSTGYTYIIRAVNESRRANRLMKENLESNLENEKIKAELSLAHSAFLRSQINPHFLFNTLNYIYSKTHVTAPEGAEAILSLSGIMRYALGNGEISEVSLLTDELLQVDRLMNVYKLRLEEDACIAIEANDDFTGIEIPSLVLVTLIENMMKHGKLAADLPGLFQLRYPDTTLSIYTKNLIADHPQTESNSGAGLKNIKARLTSYYKDLVTFTHYRDDQFFYTDISIENPLQVYKRSDHQLSHLSDTRIFSGIN